MKKKNKILSKILVVTLAILVAVPIGILTRINTKIMPGAAESAVYYITNKPVNVRSGPGYNYKVIGSKNTGEKLQTISVSNGWIQITYGNGVGYVNTDFADEYIPTAPTELSDEASVEAAKTIFELINCHRVEIGVQPLLWNDELYAAALVRAKENVTIGGHTRPDGRLGYTAINDVGINNVVRSEDVARYANSVDVVYNGWLNSPKHKESIERARYRQGAIAVYVDEAGRWYTVFLLTN